MWIVVGIAHPANRLPMTTSRYYLAEELVAKCKQHYAPNNTTFLEYTPNRFVKVNNDIELAMACNIVARSHADFYGLDVDSCVRVVDEADTTPAAEAKCGAQSDIEEAV
jgi:hypothetical protein